jgi:hypothetical protein
MTVGLGRVADEVEQCLVDLVGLLLVASQGSTRSWSPWMTRTGMLIVARSPRKSSRQAATQRRAAWAGAAMAA